MNGDHHVSLATAWNPRGEIPRFERLLGRLKAVYTGIAASIPPDADDKDVNSLASLLGNGLVITKDWSHGRHAALRKSLELTGTHVHYADTDRLIRWMETRPGEWLETVKRVSRSDCLVIGRTEAAWDTHPQALRQTECITNTLFSHWLGRPLDLSAGSKGFSRRAAEHILANSPPGRALGTDAEWIVLLHRAGFRIDSVLVDGLDWEIADRFQPQAADTLRQREVREAYDSSASNWAMRVGIALEITESGVAAFERKLAAPNQ